MQSKEFKIIGWGLAGAALSWHLFEKGCRITVYDSGENHSSRVAVGLMNPIVFRRLTMSWQADILWPFAHEYYRNVERECDEDFFEMHQLARILASTEEQNDWMSLSGNPDYGKFMGGIEKLGEEKIKHPYGVGIVEKVGRLKVSKYLDVLKKHLIDRGVKFEGSYKLEGVSAESEQTIFCTGHHLKDNPYFKYLPLNGTQGETITVRSETLNLNKIINKKIFILPITDNEFKVGATYNWRLKEPKTTEEGRADLLENLKKFIDTDFEVVDQEAGVRPTVPDRRPLIGTHPEKKNLHLFNGLGSKGVMVSPFYAAEMTDYLINGKSLSDEVNIQRFEKHYNA